MGNAPDENKINVTKTEKELNNNLTRFAGRTEIEESSRPGRQRF